MSVGYFNRHNFDDWVFIVKAGIYSSMITSQVEERTKQGRNVAEEDMQRFREEAECISEMWQDQTLDERFSRLKEADEEVKRKKAAAKAATSCFNCGIPGCEYGHCHPWDVGHSCFSPKRVNFAPEETP